MGAVLADLWPLYGLKIVTPRLVLVSDRLRLTVSR